jgi:hypothetical protein
MTRGKKEGRGRDGFFGLQMEPFTSPKEARFQRPCKGNLLLGSVHAQLTIAWFLIPESPTLCLSKEAASFCTLPSSRLVSQEAQMR